MTINDLKFSCTTPSIWVCMVEGRFLKSKGGNTAWYRKSDAVHSFKNTEYWLWLVDELKKVRPWKTKAERLQLFDKMHQELIDCGKVKYIEIKPVPEWTNL